MSVTWLFIGIVGLVFLLFLTAGIVLVCFRPTRIAGLILLPIVLFLPLLFLFWMLPPGVPMHSAIETHFETPVAQDRSFPPPPAIPVPPAPTPEQQKELDDMVAAETARFVDKLSHSIAQWMAGERKPVEASTPEKDSALSDAAAPKRQDAASTLEPLPDWVGMAPRVKGDVYQMCVTVGPYVDLQECEENKLKDLRSAFNRYVQELLGRKWSGKIRLTDQELLALVAEQYEGTAPSPLLNRMMTNLHLLVQIDRKMKTRIENAQRQWTVQTRLRQAGIGLAGVWLALGVVWGYLRLDGRHGGRRRGLLRLTAGALLGAVAAAVWWTV
ncbi:MAG: hypothetical protein JXB10_05300 [Pirellulales bacterium]|nr:hypothetical protein [Pirellulales bacterium]